MPAPAEAAGVSQLLELGAARVVVGTETLGGGAALERLRVELPDAPLVLSLDLRADRVISRDADLAGLGPAEALARLAPSGTREVIVLDLARVGSGAGPGVALLRDFCARFPSSSCWPAGASAMLADLRALAEAGAAGALVATAIHGGGIGPGDLRALSDPETQPRPFPSALRARPPRRPLSRARRPASRGCR